MADFGGMRLSTSTTETLTDLRTDLVVANNNNWTVYNDDDSVADRTYTEYV